MSKNPLLLSLLIAVAGLMNLGCQPETDPTLMLLDTRLSETRIDDLTRSMEFVISKRQFDEQEFTNKVTTGLNRWASTEQDLGQEAWSVDPLAQALVDQYRNENFLSRLKDVSFISTDAAFLQQCGWAKVVADRAAEENLPAAFEFYRLAAGDGVTVDENDDALLAYVKQLHGDLSDDDASQLAKSIRLFDWLTRNIQLLPTHQWTDEEIEEQRLYDEDNLAAAGVRGLGYTRFPSQVMLYGRGDYAERAKVFMSLLQQIDIDTVMLFVEQDGKQVPWCVGVPINGQYYLFDTRLGLPIPSRQTAAVATLAEVQSEPAMLEWLDLTVKESLADDTKYWVRGDQLDSVQPKLYVTPEAISKRMEVLEKNLNDDVRMKVTLAPSQLAERLPKIEGKEFQIWDIGFKTHAFRQAVRNALTQIDTNNRFKDRTMWQRMDESYIDGFATYRTGRSVYLHGQFHSDRNSIRGNAIERFFALMYTDDDIANLGTSKKLQRRHGILKEKGQDVASYQRALASVQAQMRLIRRDAGYFLSQCHFDNGNISTAANWLERIRDRSDAERWSDGIHYLLGRAREGTREYEQAIQVYRDDAESAQVHGNLIRARLIEMMTEESS